MFYAAGGKIYLAEPDSKGYPEVALVVDDPDGMPYLIKTGKYSIKKPENRVVYSMTEVLARFEPKLRAADNSKTK